MPKKEERKRVKFVHHWPTDYKIYPANGAWGGVSGRGDVILHFFVERHVVPEEEVQTIKEDGSLAPIERKPQEELQLARDMQVGILVNREQAVGIANWILQKVKQYEDAIKKEAEK